MNNKTTKTEQIDHLKAFIKQESRRVKFFNEQIKKEQARFAQSIKDLTKKLSQAHADIAFGKAKIAKLNK